MDKNVQKALKFDKASKASNSPSTRRRLILSLVMDKNSRRRSSGDWRVGEDAANRKFTPPTMDTRKYFSL